MDPIELLLARLRARGAPWPPPADAPVWKQIRRWRAFAESDRKALRAIHRWTDDRRRYHVDPLAERIAEAWSDLLFGEELNVSAVDDADADAVHAFVTANDLTDEARAAERDVCVPEGEVWWRIYIDAEAEEEAALVDWHSRLSVIPFWLGKKLAAAALVSILEGPADGNHGSNAVFRHLEIHAAGVVEHVLYRGTKDRLGRPIPLAQHPETVELAATLDPARDEVYRWEHGEAMLMGRIINKRGRNPRVGVSEFKRIEDQLLDLNEIATIGAENVRLTAKRRVVVPSSSVRPRPVTGPGSLDVVDDGEGGFVRADGLTMQDAVFDAGEDVLIADSTNEELGRDSTPPFKVLEYSFDAEPLIAQKRDTVETALTRVGLTPQWVGVRVDQSEGIAQSGTAYRFRLVPTTKAGNGKAKPWDTDLPRIATRGLRLAALPVGDGGLGIAVSENPAVTVDRASPLPDDPVEDAQVESGLVGARIRSRRTSISAQHPDWTSDQVDEELELIDADKPASPLGLSV